MLKLLQYLLLEFRLQITLFDLGDLTHRPSRQLLYLAPPLVHRLRIQNYHDEFEIVLLQASRQTRAGGRRDASLQACVARLFQEFVGILPLVEDPVRYPAFAGVLLGAHDLSEGWILHAIKGKAGDVRGAAVVPIVVHPMSAAVLCVAEPELLGLPIHLFIELSKPLLHYIFPIIIKVHVTFKVYAQNLFDCGHLTIGEGCP